MSKELKSFNRIKKFQVVVDHEKDEVKTIYQLLPYSCKEVETALKKQEQDQKKLKAFEIIKEKRVDVCYFMNCKTLEEYNEDVLASYAYDEDNAEQRMLIQAEFDLLKEALL